jgi:hypothetical protein
MIEFLHVADFRIEVGEPIEVGATPAHRWLTYGG